MTLVLSKRSVLRIVGLFISIAMSALSLCPGCTRAYDITRYEIVIEPDFDTGALSLKADITIACPALEREFTFGLADYYGVIEMKSKASAGTWEQTAPGWIKVVLERSAPEVVLHFELEGKPGASADESRDAIAAGSLFLLWSDRFYPISFDDWAPVRTKLMLPEGFKAIAPGRLQSLQRHGRTLTYLFETAGPAGCYSVFADTGWIETARTVNRIPMRTLLHPECQHFAERIFATSSDVLRFYSETYCPYPFDEFRFITLKGIKARRAFPGFVGYSPAYLEREFATTGLDAHETAFLWWFYTTRGSGRGGFQWTEGFGDYAELLFDRSRGMPYPEIFTTFKERYLAQPASEDVPYPMLTGDTPPEIVHGKYPWLVRVLHGMVGDERFKKGMRLLFKERRFRTFTMDEFVSTLERGTGRSLELWREEWLERKGVPAVVMESSVEQSAGGYGITVSLEQSGELYHLPIEIGMRTARGMRIERVSLHERQQTYVFTAAEAPLEIVLDPNDWLLIKKQSPE